MRFIIFIFFTTFFSIASNAEVIKDKCGLEYANHSIDVIESSKEYIDYNLKYPFLVWKAQGGFKNLFNTYVAMPLAGVIYPVAGVSLGLEHLSSINKSYIYSRVGLIISGENVKQNALLLANSTIVNRHMTFDSSDDQRKFNSELKLKAEKISDLLLGMNIEDLCFNNINNTLEYNQLLKLLRSAIE